jgi:PAS domain S-box-containing protein
MTRTERLASQDRPDPTTLDEAIELLKQEREARERADGRAALMEAILRALPSVVMLQDDENRNLFVNQALAAPLHLEEEQLLGHAWRDIPEIPVETGVEFDRAFAEAARSGEPVQYDLPVPSPDGDFIYRATVIPMRVDGDPSTYYLNVGQDITQQRLLEQKLKESQRFQTRIMQALPDLIYVFDFTTMQNVYANRTLVDHLGYDHDEIRTVGDNLLEVLLPPEDYQRWLVYSEQYATASDHDVLEFEYRAHRKDGEWCWLYSQEVIFERDEQGRATQVLGIAQDVTKRRTIELELQAAKERYDDLVANIPAMVYRIDHTEHPSRFLYVSPRVREINGVEPDAVLADSSKLFGQIHPDDIRDMLRKLRVSTQANTPFSWDGRLNVDGETKWVHLHSVPHQLPNGQIVYDGIELDITERKKLESMLVEHERLQAALEKERDLNDLKTRMMERISHEFRTPLSVIQTSADLLDRYHSRLDEDKLERQFYKIRSEINHVTQMLDSIQFVLRDHEPGGLAPDVAAFDMVALVRGAVNQARLNDSEHHTFDLKLPTTPMYVSTDSQLLRLLLSQLLENAVKFSQPGTTVRVTLEWQANLALLTVADQGRGILPAERARVFDAFFRGSNLDEISGIGLGLNIARQIVQRLSGDVDLESEIGIGTTVTVRLPLSPVDTKDASQ